MPVMLPGAERSHGTRRTPSAGSPWVRLAPAADADRLAVIRRYRFHESFDDADAPRQYGPTDSERDDVPGHLPDEATRDLVRRMHYAAYRAHRARRLSEAQRWERRYVALRNAVIAGNRKLVFRAVSLLRLPPQWGDDLTGELLLVLVRAVACFDPWLGTRFSTYACLCLKRALRRLRRRHAAQPRWAPLLDDLDAAADPEPDAPASLDCCRRVVSEILRDGGVPLSNRERTILLRRFYPPAGQKRPTLADLSREFGLSKERVRQIQAQAVSKLRRELLRRLPNDLRYEIVG